ncbi:MULTISPECIES: hypothetical protein [Acidithiobacillaceae]|jgi:hypothetical protein|uniref:Uncharacterized protein n=1 Tax=Igneacidithiobacillus copahuensis TaxID=2724909 RepID=A0AAE2YR86_9PROT|nr:MULTISPECIES: hypothetical protein [Acidithiobacillaceae]MBU2763349.1 hypothetical protein [Acidithiobacillus caldus]MBU2771188.1 hypothetical protein [Acidithiobacillus caldus]MBU2788385.1 hypothetical protein [Igneacidithiobacillus copahuensis]MBU2796377.1 hypothetical protein [Acidithiobacillus sp. VAN18-2]
MMTEHMGASAYEGARNFFNQNFPAHRPLPYGLLRELLTDMREYCQENLDWSGAEIEFRIDPTFYREADDLDHAKLGIPDNLDYDAPIWKPFDMQVWRAAGTVEAREVIFESMLWFACFRDSPAARRRHRQRDRLDGIGMGFQFFPENAQALVFLRGDRDFREIVASAIAPYLGKSAGE